MPINFDSLPDSNPHTLLEKGAYYAEIMQAEMKQPKDDASKPPYLNMRYALTNKDGKACGSLFDMLSESDKDIVRYKLKRFIQAHKIPITGSFDLKDLAKIILHKKFIVDVTIDTKSEPNRNVVDVFTNEIYYPMSDASTIFGITESTAPFTVSADDADDATAPASSQDTDY